MSVISAINVVVGASPNPERYAYKAANMLKLYGYRVWLFGVKKGVIDDMPIQQQWPEADVETVTLYIGKDLQPQYYEQIIDLKPVRVIFNPGTENEIFEKQLEVNGILVVRACTLVMLRTGQYQLK